MTTVAKIHPTLPVFRVDPDHLHRSLLYVPGHVMVIPREQAGMYEKALRDEGDAPAAIARYVHWLLDKARQAVTRWQAKANERFAPECLTLYLSNQCNAACAYCYASQTGSRTSTTAEPIAASIPLGAVRAAARLVAENCRNRGLPFWLVVHGGGEPTLHTRLVEQVRILSREAATAAKIAWKGYIATNGIVSAAHAHGLGACFGQVGLSCDGPPDIQDTQRPAIDGTRSSVFVEQTARAVKEAGAILSIRATVTPQTMRRQVEMVRYFHEVLRAHEVHLEPVYAVPGGTIPGFAPEDVADFVGQFAAATEWAGTVGLVLSCFGVPLNTMHGPYCDVLRQTLRLTPDGRAVDCFLCVQATGGHWCEHVIGSYHSDVDRFVIDDERVAVTQRVASAIPSECETCINCYHCARGCPERCLAEGAFGSGTSGISGWQVRCALAKELTTRWICRALETEDKTTCEVFLEEDSNHERLSNGVSREGLEAVLKTAPSSVDVDAILAAFERLPPHRQLPRRRMPPPLWLARGFESDGIDCWNILGSRLDQRKGPVSVYLHVPFCNRRCGFCDCLSHRLRRNERHMEAVFVDTLIGQMDAWTSRGWLATRPVTTVHLGGGTPGGLAPLQFERVTSALRARLGIGSATEWAIETTGTLLTPAALGRLRALGFSRLHVGVQTLEEGIRRRIGRRHTSIEILTRLEGALAAGFVTSVDLILGLPGETLDGFIASIDALAKTGVHGFSLYVLNRSSRNAGFLGEARLLPNSLEHYAFFQAGEQVLTRLGYAKNHFTHYARPEDKNLYYRHRRRGEDLLGLGPTADGIIGDLHYRNLDWPSWLHSNKNSAGVQGGTCESETDSQTVPVAAALMCGSVSRAAIEAAGIEALLGSWLAEGLLIPGSEQHEFSLSGNGSWRIEEMLDAIDKFIRVRQSAPGTSPRTALMG